MFLFKKFFFRGVPIFEITLNQIVKIEFDSIEFNKDFDNISNLEIHFFQIQVLK